MSYYLLISTLLFIIGSFGMFTSRKHIIITLISLEIILLAININFMVFSVYLDDFLGQIYSLLIFTVAAGESAIGLAILIVFYRLRGGISTNLIQLLKG